ncbi:MAG TPA: PEP-CTERM sorting domain-containing protein, partial [Phenylobacterium sp.]|nr:PEP-CTERM sorting domain-containing protein [Phenylobacterium sp.]
ATTLYVADSGAPKNDSTVNSGTSIGDGGLQKWSLVGHTWTLDYTLAAGLNLVANTAASGTTGLLSLTGELINGEVELFATNYTIGDTDQTYLYGITDLLSATTRPVTEQFTQLAVAPTDTTFKGVAFAPAPIPEPQAYALMIAGFGVLGGLARRRRRMICA